MHLLCQAESVSQYVLPLIRKFAKTIEFNNDKKKLFYKLSMIVFFVFQHSVRHDVLPSLQLEVVLYKVEVSNPSSFCKTARYALGVFRQALTPFIQNFALFLKATEGCVYIHILIQYKRYNGSRVIGNKAAPLLIPSRTPLPTKVVITASKWCSSFNQMLCKSEVVNYPNNCIQITSRQPIRADNGRQ